MTNPETKVRVYFIPYPPEECYIVRAIVQEMKKCARCGYDWGFYGTAKVTEQEMKDIGFPVMNCRMISENPHPFIEAKRQLARDNALKFFNKPMNVCKMCHPEGSRMRTAREEDNDKD